ncbi:hypothetical protein [Eisenibacter elegans]|uniref:hypothetical protein n=1 Tax=Eisenibacter elegans TaxID=997 RepID=UPI0004293483|nr:hypothetical protein [Eisenibacter elegans]
MYPNLLAHYRVVCGKYALNTMGFASKQPGVQPLFKHSPQVILFPSILVGE